MSDYNKPFAWVRDIMSQNTRCEIAEGVAFDAKLNHLPLEDRRVINDLIHNYIEWVFGDSTED
jgi:hypothetical protein